MSSTSSVARSPVPRRTADAAAPPSARPVLPPSARRAPLPSAAVPAVCSIGQGYLLTSRIIESRLASSLISRYLEGRHVGSGPVPALRRRAGPPLLRPARASGGGGAGLCGRPWVRAGEPHRHPGRPVAGRRDRRRGQL